MKKKLIINAATCDVSNVTAKTLEAYEQIHVNAAFLITSPQARGLLSSVRFTANVADTMDNEEGAVISIQNGSYAIKAGPAPHPPLILCVNGHLTVEPGAEEALAGFTSIRVNGKATYPESLSAALVRMQVNGTREVYPDGAILIEKNTVIDPIFILRAKDRLYYCPGTLTLTDPELEVHALAEKGTRFCARHAVIAQKHLETALPLLNEDAKITVVKEGYAYLQDSQKLTEQLIITHGSKLFVNGDLDIPSSGGDTISRLEGLQVAGQIKLPESLHDALMRKKPVYQSLFVYKGHLIADLLDCQADASLLALYPEGVTFLDCTKVTLDENLSAQDIRDKIRFVDCLQIYCSQEQKTAVESVSRDVTSIVLHSDKKAEDQEEEAQEEDQNTEVISAAMYVL